MAFQTAQDVQIRREFGGRFGWIKDYQFVREENGKIIVKRNTRNALGIEIRMDPEDVRPVILPFPEKS